MKQLKRLFLFIMIMALSVSSLSVTAAVSGTNITNNSQLGVFEELDCSVTANVVSISGKAPTQAVITVWVQEDTTSNSLVFRQFNTDADGRFLKKYILNPVYYAVDGANDASLKISGRGLNTYQITGIELYSQTELTAPITAFVGISSYADFKAFFENAGYKAVLGIEETYTEDELTVLYGFYEDLTLTGTETLQQIINTISDLVIKLDKHKDLVSKVSAAAVLGDTDEIGSLLASVTYADVMFEMDHTNILKENEMWARMANPNGYASMSEIEAAYNSAKAAQFEHEKQTGGPATTNRPKNFKSEWKVSSVANLITISGAHQDEAVTNVVIHITGLDSGATTVSGDTISALQIKTDNKGKFEATFPLNTSRFDSDVTAMLRISAPDTNIHQFYIPLYSQTAVDTMISEFKTISNVDGLKTFISNYSSMLGLSGTYSDLKYNTMYALYGEKAADYQGFTKPVDVLKAIGELTETTSDVLRFIDAINLASASGQWGLVQSAITIDHVALAEKSTTYNTLLEETEDVSAIKSVKGLYSRMLNKTYTSIQNVVDEFNSAYDAQFVAENPVTDPNPNPGNGGGGGGGGGGGNVTENGMGDEYLEDEPIIETPAPESLPSKPFADLDGYSWAATAINNLRKNNIVHGDGDGNYRPGSNMTREEYLSVLLKAYGIEIKSGNTQFTDVKADEWYSDTVATAYEIGITNGIGDGKFGIGQKISRADMVVFAARLANFLKIDIPQVEVAVIFDDYAYIPDYAYEAVVAFQQADFINGDTNGYFNPSNPTTRAEAAVFFWSIYDYINRK